ncbi:hypothetical protein L6452_36790 [Arctium lappa]|uniref:Uncharacterized protein n=1 Tax=Arctium lappa TaxID=4217 RepID=A0ACB8Y160_ARCLA|nr:hypothetical protein L6452_36790 [Arctium lappa]
MVGVDSRKKKNRQLWSMSIAGRRTVAMVDCLSLAARMEECNILVLNEFLMEEDNYELDMPNFTMKHESLSPFLRLLIFSIYMMFQTFGTLLFYFNSVQPKCSRGNLKTTSTTSEEAHHPWIKIPSIMDVGNVNNKHFVSSLKVKSLLDPCEDDSVSLGDDSMQRNENSEADIVSEVPNTFILSFTHNYFRSFIQASISDDDYIVDDTKHAAEDELLNRMNHSISGLRESDLTLINKNHELRSF